MISIGNYTLAQDNDPFIIAEAGINHNGDFELACKMIDAAKHAGANAVKFQTFKAQEFCGDKTQLFTYKSQGKEVTEPMYDMFKRMEFSPQQWRQIKAYCQQQQMMFLSTPQNYSDLEMLLDIGVDAIKVGSDDFTNLPLLEAYSKVGLPMILSCGMSDMAEIYNALSTVGAFEGKPVVLCLCTSQYPTPPQDINLTKLKTLRAAFPQLTLGLSDHSQGSLACSLAVGFGAVLFEKHFTLDRNLAGPDHWFSEDPDSLTELCSNIRLAHQMMGSSELRPTKKELSMRTLARRSIVALKDIALGEQLTEQNIGLRRPGNGLAPALYNDVLGHKAATTIKEGQLLTLGDFSHAG